MLVDGAMLLGPVAIIYVMGAVDGELHLEVLHHMSPRLEPVFERHFACSLHPVFGCVLTLQDLLAIVRFVNMLCFSSKLCDNLGILFIPITL